MGGAAKFQGENVIESNFKESKIAKFENFWKSKTILLSCEEIRTGLEDTRLCAIEGTNVAWLKEVKFIEALRVFLWLFQQYVKE